MNVGKGKQVPVSKRALMQRINRKLSTRGEVLKTTRGQRWWLDLGDHYVLDVNGNFIVATHVDDLEGYGRELEVLADYERLQS